MTTKAKPVSAWSKQVGREVEALLADLGQQPGYVAEEAGINARTLLNMLGGKSEWTLAEFVMVANHLEYTPGGLLSRCLKNGNGK